MLPVNEGEKESSDNSSIDFQLLKDLEVNVVDNELNIRQRRVNNSDPHNKRQASLSARNIS